MSVSSMEMPVISHEAVVDKIYIVIVYRYTSTKIDPFRQQSLPLLYLLIL